MKYERMPFGNRKGMLLTDLDNGYCATFLEHHSKSSFLKDPDIKAIFVKKAITHYSILKKAFEIVKENDKILQMEEKIKELELY